jgi:hypothetical protein
MQRQRNKWRADAGTRAARLVSRITSSIAKLDDEDLLDLHDIFRSDAGSPLDDMASAEMRKRNLQPETNG